MATPKTDITLLHLEQLAYDYIQECLTNTKEHPTASGKIVKILDRHIPTIDYFLRIWIPNKHKPTINRSTYYRWLNNESNPEKCNTIKNIEELFKALATNIVANEGKGIFYAKNRLGMSDKVQTETNFNAVKSILINADFGTPQQYLNDNK
jgi:hypothetical protein